MSQTPQNHLRRCRRRAGLSQEEVAFLLGCRDAAMVSRYENGTRRPSLETMLVYEVVFGAYAEQLFRGIFEEVKKRTRKQAQILAHGLREKKPSGAVLRKLSLLDAIGSRSTHKTAHHS